jgi:hypothetical protein
MHVDTKKKIIKIKVDMRENIEDET